jgi:hypothetical protein
VLAKLRLDVEIFTGFAVVFVFSFDIILLTFVNFVVHY